MLITVNSKWIDQSSIWYREQFYFIYWCGNESWSFQIDPKRAVPRGPGQQAVIAQQNSGAPVVVSTVKLCELTLKFSNV